MKKQLKWICLLLVTGWQLQLMAATLPYPVVIEDGQEYYVYSVERSIGLYRISKIFEVSQQDIIRCNPQLEKRSPYYMEELRIPKRTSDPQPSENSARVDTPKVQPQVYNDTIAQELSVYSFEPITEDTLKLLAPQEDKQHYRLDVLLPFNTSTQKKSTKTDRFISFYQGVLLALYDMQDSLHRFQVYVHNTEKTLEKVQTILEDSSLAQSNAIIGPAYPVQVEAVAEWSKGKQVPILVPFSDEIMSIYTNPNVIQFNTSYKQEAKALTDYFVKNKDKIHCVFVESSMADTDPSVVYLRKAVTNQGVSYSTIPLHSVINDSLSWVLDAKRENVLVYFSTKYSAVRPYLSYAERIQDKRVTLLCTDSWVKEDIQLPLLYTTVFSTSQLVDLTHYNELFEKYYNDSLPTTWPRYDLLGYDLTRFIVAHLQGNSYLGLQSDISVRPIVKGGGLINTNIQIKRR